MCTPPSDAGGFPLILPVPVPFCTCTLHLQVTVAVDLAFAIRHSPALHNLPHSPSRNTVPSTHDPIHYCVADADDLGRRVLGTSVQTRLDWIGLDCNSQVPSPSPLTVKSPRSKGD